MYNFKITCVMSHRGNKIKNANLSPRETVNFRKFTKMHTRENIYVHSMPKFTEILGKGAQKVCVSSG